MTSKPLVRRTLATLRKAELGFLGVVVYTRVHTPRRWGQFSIAGLLDLTTSTARPWRTSWLMVGMYDVPQRETVNCLKSENVNPFGKFRKARHCSSLHISWQAAAAWSVAFGQRNQRTHRRMASQARRRKPPSGTSSS